VLPESPLKHGIAHEENGGTFPNVTPALIMNRAKAIQYGLDMGKEPDRLAAAEEALAELAQTNPKRGFVQRASRRLQVLREHIPGFENLKLTDVEIIKRYLVPAQRSCGRKGGAAGDFPGGDGSRCTLVGPAFVH
jgi:hypothetical protein